VAQIRNDVFLYLLAADVHHRRVQAARRSHATHVVSLLRITAPPAPRPGAPQISLVAFVAGQRVRAGWASVSSHTTLGLGGFGQKFEQASTFTWMAWG